MQKFELLGQVSDVKDRTRARRARTPANIAYVAHSVIRPYFFENEAGAAILVNGLRYQTMINEFLWPELEDIDVDDVYLYQKGATSHTSGENIGLLREKFPGRAISRNDDYYWPPRSCDLTPLDFFLWDDVEDKVYADAPHPIQELKEKIRAIIDEIEPQMCSWMK